MGFEQPTGSHQPAASAVLRSGANDNPEARIARSQAPANNPLRLYLLRGGLQAALSPLRDKELKAEITRVHRENLDVYGVEKVWKQLRRESIACGRDRAGRLMAELELVGAVRGKTWPVPCSHLLARVRETP